VLHELHLAKLIEKQSGIPFAPGPRRRLEPHEIAAAVSALEGAATWIPTTTTNGDAMSLLDILDAADGWLGKGGEWELPALIIDPWNEIAHQRERHISETEYIGQSLGLIRRWARERGVHVFLVAHPQKLPRESTGKLPVPRPDNISGSQHWWNKADNCITVWRDIHADPPSRIVQIHVQKVRFKHHGRIGAAELEYDRIAGRYTDPAAKVVSMHGRKAKSKPITHEGTIEL